MYTYRIGLGLLIGLTPSMNAMSNLINRMNASALKFLEYQTHQEEPSQTHDSYQRAMRVRCEELFVIIARIENKQRELIKRVAQVSCLTEKHYDVSPKIKEIKDTCDSAWHLALSIYDITDVTHEQYQEYNANITTQMYYLKAIEEDLDRTSQELRAQALESQPIRECILL